MTIHETVSDGHRWLAARLNADGGGVILESPAWPVLPFGGGEHVQWRGPEGDHRNLFAGEPYFVSKRQVASMSAVVQAVESVVERPAYREHVLCAADHISRVEHGPKSVFFGYDFHLGESVPKLVEINTNAGGALLNATMARSRNTSASHDGTPFATFENISFEERDIVEMFRSEWRRQRGDMALETIAIVDTAPDAQYLGPEFRLFERLFRASGMHAVVADPSELEWHDAKLWHRSVPIDLVYNRLTDFSLSELASTPLRSAYLTGGVVVTPHPRAHALYADKRILAVLTDEKLLRSWGVTDGEIRILASGIPRTVVVNGTNCEQLWQSRRKLFFKPAAGFGSKGAYRGDKITKRVWEEILAGDYVAQDFVLPGVRQALVDGKPVELKVDVRNYVYDGRVQMVVARMFQGQTTNFRTPGGGFAPVYEVQDAGHNKPAERLLAETIELGQLRPVH